MGSVVVEGFLRRPGAAGRRVLDVGLGVVAIGNVCVSGTIVVWIGTSSWKVKFTEVSGG
jgi:hypothetical protein